MNYNINGMKIIIRDSVISDIKKYYRTAMAYETGGILLGKFNRENRIIEITEVYELKTHFFSKILYKRSTKKAQKIINSRWNETNGRINYIGEWHTHPNMQPNPSITDLKSLEVINLLVKNILPSTILIIIGKDEKVNIIVQNTNGIKMKLLTKEKCEEG